MNRWNIKDPEYNHAKVWGGERWMVNREEYCGKLLFVRKNYKVSYHCHKIKHETFVILKGMVYMHLGDEEFIMEEGDAVEVPQNVYHSFTGITDATILEISTQHFEDDSYRKNKSRKLDWKDRRLLKKVLKHFKEKQ